MTEPKEYIITEAQLERIFNIDYGNCYGAITVVKQCRSRPHISADKVLDNRPEVIKVSKKAWNQIEYWLRYLIEIHVSSVDNAVIDGLIQTVREDNKIKELRQER